MSGPRRYGPGPKEFRAAFGVGGSDEEIHPVDAVGVALAALQGLHGLLRVQADELEDLHRRLQAVERSSPQPG